MIDNKIEVNLVKIILQEWIDEGYGDYLFWEPFSNCPTPYNVLTPSTVIAAMPDTKALEAADALAEAIEDSIDYFDAPQSLRDALATYRAARATKP